MTFSGGGSRAAALAYGVLEALSQTSLDDNSKKGSMLDAATTTPLLNYNFETLEYLRGNLAAWRNELHKHKCQDIPDCEAPEIFHIDLQLEDIADSDWRNRLASIPTDFSLPPGTEAELIQAAHQLLRNTRNSSV